MRCAVVKLGLGDSPYLGCCGLYGHFHGDDGLCWDELDTHRRLLVRMDSEFDGWALHLTSPSLGPILGAAADAGIDGFRVMAWVKPFAAFKRNVPVAYAWEPVLVKEARKPEVTGRCVMRDWIAESITLRRGFTGAKPEAVCRWLFECMGAHPDDEFHDLFPGSGAVSRAWDAWVADVRGATTADQLSLHSA